MKGIIILLLTSLLLSGCATYSLQVRGTENVEQIVQRGVYIGKSEMDKTTCLLIANIYSVEDGYFEFRMGIKNNTDSNILLKPTNFKLFGKKNGQWIPCQVYSPKHWKTHLKANQFWTALAASMQAVSDSMNAGYSETTTQSYYNISTNATVYGPYGITNIYGSGNVYGDSYSTTYDHDKAIQTKIMAEERAQKIIEETTVINNIIRSMLFEVHTLLPGEIYEGNIYAKRYNYKEFKVEFVIDDEVHVFHIDQVKE